MPMQHSRNCVTVTSTFYKGKGRPILVAGVLGNGAYPVLGSQPAGDSMHCIVMNPVILPTPLDNV